MSLPITLYTMQSNSLYQDSQQSGRCHDCAVLLQAVSIVYGRIMRLAILPPRNMGTRWRCVDGVLHCLIHNGDTSPGEFVLGRWRIAKILLVTTDSLRTNARIRCKRSDDTES